MKKEQIVDFTRRISQANRSGLVVVMYDIFFTYLDDARAAYDAADWDAYKEALRRAQRAIDELISALNFSYDMAKNLYSIYSAEIRSQSLSTREIWQMPRMPAAS